MIKSEAWNKIDHTFGHMHVNRSCLWSCARLFNEIYPNLNKLHANPHIQHRHPICTSFLIPVVRLYLLVANWIRDMMYLHSKYKNNVESKYFYGRFCTLSILWWSPFNSISMLIDVDQITVNHNANLCQ